MVNSNPDTVSTNYDTYVHFDFEPVTSGRRAKIVRIEKPNDVIVQYGGQMPLKLARTLEAADGAGDWFQPRFHRPGRR